MKYNEISLGGITKILRAHATQIVPPGMRELKNVYLSRSDTAITLRPDFYQEITDMLSLAPDIVGISDPEFLTAIYSIIDFDASIYFSNLAPFSAENAARLDLSTIYEEGTISTDGRRPIVNGLNTEWFTYAWAGCKIREKGTDAWYSIIEVKSDSYIITSPTMPALTNAEYQILRTHPASNGVWPMQFERLGNILVYNPANPQLPINKQEISGPFYSDVGRADIFGVWREFTPKIEPVTGKYGCLAAGFWVWPLWGGSLAGSVNILAVAGEKGFLTVNNQWVGNWDDTSSQWAETRAKYTYLDTNAKLAWPRGAGYPVSNEYRLLPNGSDSPIVGIELYSVCNGVAVLENGTMFLFARSGGWVGVDLLSDNWVPDYITAPWDISLDGSRGVGYKTGVFFGENGRIRIAGSPSYECAGLTEATIYDACYIEESLNNWCTTGTPRLLVGGVDNLGATILINGGGGEDFRILHNVGTTELYGCAFLNALEEGEHGIGTCIAVGAYGTVLFSDDGAKTWESVEHNPAEGRHIRAIMTDFAGRIAMAVGDGGLCMWTEDAVNWEELNISKLNLIDISYCIERGEFVVLPEDGDPIRVKRRFEYGRSDRVMLKKIGDISTNSYDTVFSVIWDGSQFIAAGNKIWTSPTGETWTLSTFPANIASNPIACLAHNGAGTIVGVGAKGSIYRSTDSGVNWATILGPGSNPDISGTILSVIWDDYNFICCGGTKILRSATGAAWAEETFAFTQEPMFLTYAGAGEVNPFTGTEIHFNLANTHVVCKSGAIFYRSNQEWDGLTSWTGPVYSDWVAWEEIVGSSYGYPKMTPAAAVSQKPLNRLVIADAIYNTQSIWVAGVYNEGQPGYLMLKHEIGRTGDASSNFTYPPLIPAQEPEVRRYETLRPRTQGTGGPVYNQLLIHNKKLTKNYDTTIIFWLHCAHLLISTDAGMTWSKGCPLVIPVRNEQAIVPDSGVTYPGVRPRGSSGSALGIPHEMAAMVSDETDVYLVANADGGVGTGLQFYSITWDGLQPQLGDSDLPPVNPESVKSLQIEINAQSSLSVQSFSVVLT